MAGGAAEIKSWTKTALDQDDIKSFCKTNSLPYHMLNLGPAITGNPYFSFVFTGDTKTEYNKGNTNHWMFCFGPKQPNSEPKHLFDSYGDAASYFLPESVRMIKLMPSRLQEFAPASVCGQYCCVFYHWLKNSFLKDDDHKIQDVGREFVHHFGFTTDRLENDKIILEEFKKLAGIPESKPSHPPQPKIVTANNAESVKKPEASNEPSEAKTADVSKATAPSLEAITDESSPKTE